MARMVVIYKTPSDPKEFDKHYFEVHIPMAKKLPGIRKYEVNKGPIISLAGAKDTYLIATLYFDSLDEIKKAFETEIGHACAEDRRKMAPNDDIVQMFLFEDRIV